MGGGGKGGKGEWAKEKYSRGIRRVGSLGRKITCTIWVVAVVGGGGGGGGGRKVGAGGKFRES